MTDTCKAITELLGCDFEYFSAAAGGRAIYRRYKMLARQGESGGYVPLVVYVTETLLEALLDNLAGAGVQSCVAYRDKLLPKAESINAIALLQTRFSAGVAEQEPSRLLGGFVNVRTIEGEQKLCVSCRNNAREVLIAKFPARAPWELPLLLPMGGFNDCPLPWEQAAVFRFWHESYGAVPVVAGYDVWELRVTRPPMQLVEAEQLALQQFAFDYDLVLEAGKDADSIRALASHLREAKAWYFWWD